MMSRRKTELLMIGLACVSFISLGLPDGLNGVAWPSIRAYFDLQLDALGVLLMMFTIGYLVSSFNSGQLLARMSVGSLLAASCLATSASLIGYALAPAWWVMVALGILAGLGAGAIDGGLNTYAATQFSPRMVNWLHACYGVGAAGGPVIMTLVLAAHHRWQLGYAIVGGGQLFLAICFGLTRKQWLTIPARSPERSAVKQNERVSNLTTLRLPVVWLGAAVFFLYTGIEAAAGTWAYSLFTEARGVPMMVAGMWVSIYWGSLTAGRLLAGFFAGFVPAHRLLLSCMVGIALGATLVWFGGEGYPSFIGLGLMGLASAPVFPTMISSTPGRLGGTHTANAIGFQIAAAVLGQSMLPAFIGLLAKRIGLEIVGPALLVSALSLIAFHFLLRRPRESERSRTVLVSQHE
ncbi:MAG TPA: MFS transporter [Blastocatellia bacterium]|nr:MFS transporter [Blastocatellia bacterium]